MNPLKYTLVFFVVNLLVINSVYTQDLTVDKAFFQSKAEVYQDWLERSGFAPHLKVHVITVEPKSLSLYLAFPYKDLDSINVAWDHLKENFEAQKSITLEEQLFYKMVSLMEVNQNLANLQIYDTYDTRETPLFFRGIYFDSDTVAVEKNSDKGPRTEIVFDKPHFSDKRAESEYRKRFSKEEVYNKIYEFAERKYQTKNCEDRTPKVRLLENQKNLRFEVVNLCREVIQERGIFGPILEKLGFTFSWAKKELLTFIIVHTETTSGFKLDIELEGKFGSSLYEDIRRGGYMDMESDFKEELENYADAFSAELRNEILKP